MATPTVEYKKFRILATPYQLSESKGWTLRISIENHTGPEVHARNFSRQESFATKEVAVQQCFAFGKKIIDEEVEGLSVVDL